MKKTTLIKLGMLTTMLGAAAARAQVINFHDANVGTIPGYNQLYFGQGAYSDPGNNVWNGFSAATYAGGGPGSTLFFGYNNPYPASGGNPGNPYAAYGTNGIVTGSGSVIFGSAGTTPPGTTPAGNVTSSGVLSPITLKMNYGFDNGATANATLGQPSWLFADAAVVNNGATGTFELDHVPAGTYTIYLYGANYDDDRGTSFTVSSGTAHNGISGTLNDNAPHGSGTSPASAFVEGINYVIFNSVHPDASGTISGTWFPNPADGVGNSNLSGEGDFNGMQLVKNAVVVQPALSIHASGLSVTVSWAPAVGTLQAADAVTGTYTNLTGVTSPYVTSATGAHKFYRVVQ
ncbi:MAG: hypothetical protein JWR26_2944 [Pedosphaera sp.]|nr:hypothetical protein [Pedosphaera sp.]